MWTELNPQLETIAAISTPPGKGGVAVIRVSGRTAIEVAASSFRAKNGSEVSLLPDRLAVYGDILSGGVCIDDGILTLFRAPRSYTGEDVAEISCHGGRLIQAKVLQGLLEAGARLAGPGEFTRRAVLRQRLPLTEAEAVGALIDAETEEQLLLSAKQSRSQLSRQLDAIIDALLRVLSIHFSQLDFPDEDPVDASPEKTVSWLASIRRDIDTLCDSYPTGRAISEGISVALIGKPNVGKSSLYNALLGESAAIVTEIAGTTRDVLEHRLTLGRVLVRLYDTAGIRNTDDPIERIGVERSRERIEASDAQLVVLDRSLPLTEEDREILDQVKLLGKTPILLLNKSDLPSQFGKEDLSAEFAHVIECSADTGEGLDTLRNTVDELFTDTSLKIGEAAILTTARQLASLKEASDALTQAIFDFRNDVPLDAAVSGIERALAAIMRTNGRMVNEEIVEEIFKNFCVGK